MSEESNTEKGIRNSLDLIRQSISALDKKIEEQGKRIDLLEGVRGEGASSQATVVDDSMQAPQPLPPSNRPEDRAQQAIARTTESMENSPAISFSEKREEKGSLEENIGGKWFARIGIAAIVLGVSFFLKYAFDNDWIGEAGRVAIGMFIGLALLGIGEKTIRKYSSYGQMISGGGIAVLYLSIFSAFNFYHLVGPYVAFFVMMLITATGIVLSLRYDALPLMMVSMVGGFATPFMASTGENNQLSLFSYITLLNLAILAVSISRKWHLVSVAGFLGTILLFLSWGERFYTDDNLGLTMFFLTLSFLIYSISSLVYNLVKKERSTGSEQVLTLLSAVAYFSASYALLKPDYYVFMGFFAIILAIYYLLWAFLVRSITPEDENLHGFLAFLTVGFVTLAIPIQFKQSIITISWAIEAALLMLVGVKLKRNFIIAFSFVISSLALFKFLILDNARYGQFTMAMFNGVFLTAAVLTAAMYCIAYIIHAFSDENSLGVKRKALVAIFVVAANFVTIFSISKEIVESYDRKIQNVYNQQNREMRESLSIPPSGQSLNRKVSVASQDTVRNLRNKSSISLSIFWLVYSVVLLTVGVFGKYKGVRIGGLALLTLAILKLFFVDLWSLGTFYRIISSISLGVVLLSISFVYQKHKDSIKQII